MTLDELLTTDWRQPCRKCSGGYVIGWLDNEPRPVPCYVCKGAGSYWLPEALQLLDKLDRHLADYQEELDGFEHYHLLRLAKEAHDAHAA